MANFTAEEILAQMLSWTDEQKDQIWGGYENRGMECVTERWYAPDDLPDDSPFMVAVVAMNEAAEPVEEAFRQFYDTHLGAMQARGLDP